LCQEKKLSNIQRITYILGLLVLYPLSLLPFSVLHLFSDGIRFLLSKVFKYRSTVIDENLLKAFPGKSNAERAVIKHDFYRNLSDTIVETVKSTTVSKDVLLERVKIENHELLDYWHEKKQPIIVVMAHQCNFEWAVLRSAITLKQNVVIIYKPLSNPYFDAFFKKNRSRFGANLLPMKAVTQYFKDNTGTSFCGAFVSDQSPRVPDRAHWVDFLNTETAVLPGVGLLAKKYNLPILYASAVRNKRGHYTFRIEPLIDDPSELTALDISKAHTQRLERMILDCPSDWLWSHKRWKHKRK